MSDIRITAAQIEEWKARRAVLSKELEELDLRLRVVELFSSAKPTGGGIDPDNKVDLVMGIVRDANRLISPKQIKEILRGQHVSENGWGHAYSYVNTILFRQTKRGKLIKRGSKYKPVAD